MKSLAGKIDRRKLVCAPEQPAHKRMSRTGGEGIFMRGISRMYIRIHTLAASRAGSVPIEYRLKAGKIRFERTCCILEKLASMSCSSKCELKIETENIREL